MADHFLAHDVAYCKERFCFAIDIAPVCGAKISPTVRRDPRAHDFDRFNISLSAQRFVSVLVSEFCVGRGGSFFRERRRGEGGSKIRDGQDADEC